MAIIIAGVESRELLHSLAWSLCWSAVHHDLPYTTRPVAVHTVLPFSTQTAACLHLAAPLLQLCLAVGHHSSAWVYFVSDHRGCVCSCQLVAPLSRTRKPEQSSVAVMASYWLCLVLPNHTCTHPDCFLMEKQQSISHCEVLPSFSSVSRFIHREMPGTHCWWCSRDKGSPFCQRQNVSTFTHVALESK